MFPSSSQTLVLDLGLRSWRRGKDVCGVKVVNIFSSWGVASSGLLLRNLN